VAEIDDLANSGVRRLKTQVLGVLSHEAAKWREDRSHPSKEDRWQRSMISRTREFAG
jgi:hypothetical protein